MQNICDRTLITLYGKWSLFYDYNCGFSSAIWCCSFLLSSWLKCRDKFNPSYANTDIWNKVFQNEPSKICGRHPVKSFTWSVLEFLAWFISMLSSILRSSHRRCSIKKGAVKTFAKSTEKHLCESLFLNKIAGPRHRCFPVSFEKFLRIPFLQNISDDRFFILQ